MTVDPSTVTLAVGATKALAATAHFSDGSSRTVTADSVWTSSSSSVATVSGGVVTGVGGGQANIAADYLGHKATVGVTITAPTVASLVVSPPFANVTVGGTIQLSALATLSNQTTQNVTQAAIWTANGPGILLTAPGRVSALSPGTATVTVTYQGRGASATISVQPLPAPMLTISGPTSVGRGEVLQLNATLTASGAPQDVTDSAVWHSSSPNVTHAGKGLFIIGNLSTGSATVTATYQGLTATFTVEVT